MESNPLKFFGIRVFSDSEMKKRIPPKTYEKLHETIDQGLPLDRSIADEIAKAMRDWAIEQGATHFTHWFQPLTNITAGKHDAFIAQADDGNALLEFSGKELIMGEPDASSFPSGGLRATFEARGYTAWDCTSTAFVNNNTLYIPTAFCSYSGEALDKKTPLLRSMEVLSREAVKLLRLLGDNDTNKVIATVGAEQEYFLIDRQLYEKRLDLKICGRTLFGAKPTKGQELDDHYCGRIRIRVSEFMKELDQELWQLGIFSKTKHNEVAPAQHELAVIYSSANVACDHNQLLMETMRRVAKKHSLACLLHEKPFNGINGSGKHNNWSMMTDKKQNLLEPGKNPETNIRFLLFLAAIIEAVDNHADLLRLSAASAGNDHRLGANEAPPAIISIFLGDELTTILENIALQHKQYHSVKSYLETGVSTLPKLNKDSTDRNRTSPFAFTGNKFEFRMVGSSASIADANFILNTIVAESLSKIADRLKGSSDIANAAQEIIADIINNHRRIIFNGNNYCEEWKEEAKRRGLPNLSNTVDAISVLKDKKNISVLSKFGVLSKSECLSRYEILMENYHKTLHIETSAMLEMLKRQIIPDGIKYISEVSRSCNLAKESGHVFRSAEDLIKKLINIVDNISDYTHKLENALAECDKISNHTQKAKAFRDTIIPVQKKVREFTDELESNIPSDIWSIPTYTDLLHRV